MEYYDVIREEAISEITYKDNIARQKATLKRIADVYDTHKLKAIVLCNTYEGNQLHSDKDFELAIANTKLAIKELERAVDTLRMARERRSFYVNTINRICGGDLDA